MTANNLSPLTNFRYDLPAALVVFLVALPLCLGIALASAGQANIFSGVIAGMVGGIVVGLLSGSPLSVSGPAAGLTTIVAAAIAQLHSFEAFLLSVFLAGVFQIAFGLLRVGFLGNFIPSAVIKGMLAAIGLILILKQLPHAVGYDKDFEGDFSFNQPDGENTFSALRHLLDNHISWGAVIIALISLLFLFWWDAAKFRKNHFLSYLPGPLVVVVFGILANEGFMHFAPELAIAPEHLVSLPQPQNASEWLAQFKSPDFSLLGHQGVWSTALTLSLVASVETLLSIEAVDKLDPFKRNSPTNRELLAQGAGNMVSGLLGGLPVTSVIVRSSANVDSGGRTKASTILHGLLLLICVVAIPFLLVKIPLSALAAVLISVGYKLTKPSIFQKKWKKGLSHFVPFVLTIAAILLTDLLVGIGIGLVVGTLFVVRSNFQSAIVHVTDGNQHLIRFRKDLSFIHKSEVRSTLDKIPEGSVLILDLSKINFIDLDNAEAINDFIGVAPFKNIQVELKQTENQKHLFAQPQPAS
jgi:MFS superfamily sulfate permease-like transporter